MHKRYEDKLNDLAVFLDGQIEKLNKLKHGGKRQKSGAKPKYNEKTTTIAFRVPESHTDNIKSIVKDYLDKILL